MITKKNIANLRELHHKEGREQAQLFIVEGTKSCLEVMNSSMQVMEIFATEKWQEKHSDLQLPNITTVAAKEMERISTLKTTPEVLATVKIPSYTITDIYDEAPLLVLDHITDPGNLGTMIRTADWFGYSQILCSEKTVDFTNPKVIQATMGSFTRMKVIHTPLLPYLNSLNNRDIFGLCMNGEAINEIPFPKNPILIVGNESRGISDEVMQLLTCRVHIPTFNPNSTSAESLNAAVATAVALYECSRQKTQ